MAPQSVYSDRQRAALIAASGAESTVRTMAFDVVRGTTGWPSGIDGRALNNLTVQDLESGENVEEVRRKFQEAVKVGDSDRMLVWAGTGVGLMDEVKDAGVSTGTSHGCSHSYSNARLVVRTLFEKYI